MKIWVALCGAALAAIASVSTAQATTLSGNLTADNDFAAYISTDDSVLGTFLTGGNDWTITNTLSQSLTAGVTNYLHIVALNQGGPDGFIGSFSLSDSLFKFANGTQSLVTDVADWTSSTGAGTFATPTWSAPGSAPISLGVNGVAPWGAQSSIDALAAWIWRSPDTQNHGDLAFFSTAITTNVAATPIPASLPLFASALGGLGFMARRKRRAQAA